MMIATTPVPQERPETRDTLERRVVASVLAFSGVGAGIGLLIRVLTQSVSRFDVVALSIFAVLLCALAVGVGRMGFPIRTLYRLMTGVAATYILTELGVTLLLATDAAGSEKALRPLPGLMPFVYLFAFMGWRAREALVTSGGFLLLVVLGSGALIGVGAVPAPGTEAALDFYLEFAVAHVLLIGMMVLFARARGQVGQAQRELAAMGQLARTDSLTGVLNRRGFQELLEIEAERNQGRDCRLALVLIDLDHFKRVNDRFGHPAGDAALVEFGQLLTQLVRTTDALGRWGGEEFVILLRRAAPGEALFLADRLRRAVEEHTFASIGELTASFGVAELNADDSLQDLILQADEALYRAKASGRNRTCASRKMMEAMSGGDRSASTRSQA